MVQNINCCWGQKNKLLLSDDEADEEKLNKFHSSLEKDNDNNDSKDDITCLLFM